MTDQPHGSVARRHGRGSGWVARALTIGAIVLLAASVASASMCGRKAGVVRIVNERGAEPLTAALDHLLAAPRSEAVKELPEAAWPDEIRALRPKRVRVTLAGVFVTIDTFFSQEWGLYLPPASLPVRESAGTDPSLERITGRLFWYHIKG